MGVDHLLRLFAIKIARISDFLRKFALMNMTPFTGDDRLRDLLVDNNFLLHVVSRFGLAFGFGNQTVAEVCSINGVDCHTFLAVCNLISSRPYDGAKLKVDTLINFLRNSHRTILDITLPHIRHHLIEAINATETERTALLLLKFYDSYVSEVRAHMNHEEREIFSTISGRSNPDYEGVLVRYTAKHEPMSEKLRELKDLIIFHNTTQDNARLAAALFDIILCEQDLDTHFEIENKLLVPTLRRLKVTQVVELEPEPTPVVTPDMVLGEREREIVALIAKGLSNKQIAEQLFISSHTVATHRRNICNKLDIHSASGLTLYAVIHQLIDINDIRQ